MNLNQETAKLTFTHDYDPYRLEGERHWATLHLECSLSQMPTLLKSVLETHVQPLAEIYDPIPSDNPSEDV